MRRSDVQVVRSLPLFQGMASHYFDTLIHAALLQRFPSRALLIAEGDLPDFLHVIVEGTVEMFATHEGRETTVDILAPVTTFILAAVVRDEPYLKSARTLTPSRVLLIPAETVRDVFSRDAAFARAVVNELALRYRSIVRSLKDHKLRTGVERLANWILAADRRQGGGGRIALSFDKRTLAARLGMTAENLSRNLSTLAEHGVTSRPGEFAIVDRAALERLAKPTPLIDGDG